MQMMFLCCERTKLVSKSESKSQLLLEHDGHAVSCERTKLVSKSESNPIFEHSKENYILMHNNPLMLIAFNFLTMLIN